MSGYVYFLHDRLSGLVKIGWAKNPESRCSGFQTGCPGQLELLSSHVGGRDLEAAWHRVYASARIRGEWFWPLPCLMEHVGRRDLGRYLDDSTGNMAAVRERLARGESVAGISALEMDRRLLAVAARP